MTVKKRRVIVFGNEKAEKRTLTGKDSREKPPWAASGFCRNRRKATASEPPTDT